MEYDNELDLHLCDDILLRVLEHTDWPSSLLHVHLRGVSKFFAHRVVHVHQLPLSLRQCNGMSVAIVGRRCGGKTTVLIDLFSYLVDCFREFWCVSSTADLLQCVSSHIKDLEANAFAVGSTLEQIRYSFDEIHRNSLKNHLHEPDSTKTEKIINLATPCGACILLDDVAETHAGEIKHFVDYCRSMGSTVLCTFQTYPRGLGLNNMDAILFGGYLHEVELRNIYQRFFRQCCKTFDDFSSFVLHVPDYGFFGIDIRQQKMMIYTAKTPLTIYTHNVE